MKPATLLIALAAVPAAFLAGLGLTYRAEAAPAGRTVAMSWGDGRYGPAFYGAHVYVDEGEGPALPVRAVVYIHRPGRFMYYVHDCGEIGRAKDWPEAVAKFGTIQWSPEGLRIGDYFLPRGQLENHR
ncbi:MAG TPA: hypothetical protein VFA20_31880 [Myxococcaceae bacterium]|nr:hypothetical protein [Myxococcaceae bacterium]